MSRQACVDPLPHLEAVARAVMEAGFYDEGDVPVGQAFAALAALAAPALLELTRG